MSKRLLIGLVMVVFLISVVSATDTEINLKTLPNHEVQLTTFDSSSIAFSAFESFKGESDEYGDVSFIFSSNEYEFGIIVFVKKDNEKVVSKKFSDTYSAGEQIDLELVTSGFEILNKPEPETFYNFFNNTCSKISILESEKTDSDYKNLTECEAKIVKPEGGITGLAIKDVFSGSVIYYVGGVILLLIIAFIILKILKKRKKSKGIKVRKLSELQSEKKEDVGEKEKIIEDAEQKIREAQEDIRKIKNEDKIKEARIKIEEDEKELIKLREGKE